MQVCRRYTHRKTFASDSKHSLVLLQTLIEKGDRESSNVRLRSRCENEHVDEDRGKEDDCLKVAMLQCSSKDIHRRTFELLAELPISRATRRVRVRVKPVPPPNLSLPA